VIAKRVLAVLAAAALIVAAILIRNGIDDDSTDAGAPSTGRPRVVCSTEFESVCESLDSKKYDISIDAAGDTLDALAKKDADPPDAWVTLDPFPSMVDVARRQANEDPFTATTTVIAQTDPALATIDELMPSATAVCKDKTAWACLGAAANKSWTDLGGSAGGRVLVGVANPAKEASGLLTFANAVLGYFNATAVDTSSFHDAGYRSWLRTLSNGAVIVAIGGGTSPLSTMLIRKTKVNVAATSGAELAAAGAQAKVSLLPLTNGLPELAVVARYSSRGAELNAAIATALAAGGWGQPSDSQPQLDAGTFIALRHEWEDVHK
jgi:hypothetical protein